MAYHTLQKKLDKEFPSGKIGIEIQTKNNGSYERGISKLRSLKLTPSAFPYIVRGNEEINLPDESLFFLRIRMLSLRSETNKSVFYPLNESGWGFLDTGNTLSLITLSPKYNEWETRQFKILGNHLFDFLVGGKPFSDAVQRIVEKRIENLLDERVGLLEKLNLDNIAKMIPKKIRENGYTAFALPAGEPVLVFIDREGVFLLHNFYQVKSRYLELITTDIDFYDPTSLPSIFWGVRVPKSERTGVGKDIKHNYVVLFDCWVYNAIPYVSQNFNRRYQKMTDFFNSADRSIEGLIKFSVSRNISFFDPDQFFVMIKTMITSSSSLFYRMIGFYFVPRGEMGDPAFPSYFWTLQKDFSDVKIETLLQQDNALVKHYLELEKKYMLNFTVQRLKRSLTLIDTSEKSTIENYWQVYDTKHQGKVDVVFLDQFTDPSWVDSKVKPGGSVLALIPERELVELTEVDIKSYRLSDLIKALPGYKFRSWICDRQLLGYEPKYRIYSATIFIKPGKFDPNGTKPMTWKKTEYIPSLRFVPLKQIEKTETPISIKQDKTPKFSRAEFKPPNQRVPIPIQIPGGKKIDVLTRYKQYASLRPNEEQPKEQPKECRILPVDDKEKLYSWLGTKFYRQGVIGDGSCMIHAVLVDFGDNVQYEEGNRETKTLIAQKYRRALAKYLTEENYSKLSQADLKLDPSTPGSRQWMIDALTKKDEYLDAYFFQLLMNFFDVNIVVFRCQEEPYVYDNPYDPERPTIFICYVSNIHYESVFANVNKIAEYIIEPDTELGKKIAEYFAKK